MTDTTPSPTIECPAEIAAAIDELAAIHDRALTIYRQLGGYDPAARTDPPPPRSYETGRYSVTLTEPNTTTEHGRHVLAAWCEGTVNGVEVRGTLSAWEGRPYDQATDSYGAPEWRGSGYGLNRWEPYGPASDAARTAMSRLMVEHVQACGWTLERLALDGAVDHARGLVWAVANEVERVTYNAGDGLRAKVREALAGEVVR